MKTVWVISSGSYSDYQVHAVVKGKRKDAEALARRANVGRQWDQYEIERLPVVEADVQQVEILTLTTTLWDNGKESERGGHTRIEWPFDATYGTPAVSWRWVRAPIYNNCGGRLDVYGTDHERVRRVFSDRRAQLMADGAMRKIGEASGSR